MPWLKSWVQYVIAESLDAAAMQQVFMTRAIYRSMDFRHYKPELTRANIKRADWSNSPFAAQKF